MQRTQSKKPSFPAVILIILLVFAFLSYTYKTVIDKIEENKQLTIRSYKEEQFDIIWTSLDKLISDAEKNVTDISNKIEHDILNLSQDQLKQLEQDMNNDVLNHDLHDILNSNIKGKYFNNISNHMNGFVVMTIDGYIEDFNYYRADNSSDSNIRDWQSSIDKSYNKDLERDAIDKLLNRTSGIIALESYNLSKYDNHIKIQEFTHSNILDVYLNEGIEGLRNYQIFVPYYITDFGDIFGEPDIIHGVKQDNNKLIIVQEFNLYDQIIEVESQLFGEDQVDHAVARYTDLLRLVYLLGIGFTSFGIGVVIVICSIFGSSNNRHEEIIYTGDESQEETQDNNE